MAPGPGYLCPVNRRFLFPARYFLFWLLYFALSRAFFLLYHYNAARTLPATDLLGTFAYGLRLDASATAYLCLVPFLLFSLGGLFRADGVTDRLTTGYTAVFLLIVSFLQTADLELYRVWGFRLDDTPLQYLTSPGEMAASAGSAPLLLLVGLFVGMAAGGWGIFRAVVGARAARAVWFGRGRAALAGLLYTALLVLPLRGGTQQIPINQSDVYFSTIPFANHAALNAPWNMLSSALRSSEVAAAPVFMPAKTARQLLAQVYPAAVGAAAVPDSTASILAEPRPNVLFIILESFTSKLVGSVGGEPGVTPTLDSLARTGVLFNNIYAAGDRSQKGLVALLSGYPSQPTTSIIKYPRKSESLPHLARSLAAVGYRSRYYYGGELAFANMKSYLRTAGYEKLTERTDFAEADQNSKWGAHDGVLFKRMLGDLPQQPQPFFVTAFTLSSHEPFEVPMKPRFPGTDETTLFRNSVYYTDYALGQFLREAQRQPWYAHTLLVLVADHGHPPTRQLGRGQPAQISHSAATGRRRPPPRGAGPGGAHHRLANRRGRHAAAPAAAASRKIHLEPRPAKPGRPAIRLVHLHRRLRHRDAGRRAYLR